MLIVSLFVIAKSLWCYGQVRNGIIGFGAENQQKQMHYLEVSQRVRCSAWARSQTKRLMLYTVFGDLDPFTFKVARQLEKKMRTVMFSRFEGKSIEHLLFLAFLFYILFLIILSRLRS